MTKKMTTKKTTKKKVTTESHSDQAIDQMNEGEFLGEMKRVSEPKTNGEVDEIMSKEIKHSDAKQFLHCKHCLTDYKNGIFGQGMSPRDAMNYETGVVDFEWPVGKEKGKKIGVVTVFCKRCSRPVWDTRHLTNLF
jgi:hypothetical protein